MNQTNHISSFFSNLPIMLFSFFVLCIFIITQFEDYKVPATEKNVFPPRAHPPPDVDDPAERNDTLVVYSRPVFI